MRERRALADDGMTERFDLGDAGDFVDGPTVLPAPWSEPPDPEFRTGTVPQLQRADLSGDLPPGLEPSTSCQKTVRFSREEVLELMRSPTARSLKPAPAAARVAPPPAAARVAPPPAAARVAPPPAAARVEPAAAPARPSLSPARAARATRPREARRSPLSRIKGDHVTAALALGSAFALGVLTGILAMS